MQQDRRCADVIFASADDVKHTLHAYSEQPLFVHGREIFVFREYTKINRGAEGSDKESGMDIGNSSRATRTGQDHGDEAVFVSN